MICCGTDLGKGEPYVMLRYWCDKCKTEHLVNAREMSDYLAAQAVRQEQGDVRLPPLL
jgi:hypothetical protein